MKLPKGWNRKALTRGYLKYCPACEKPLPLDRFDANDARQDGLQSQCRECRKALRSGRMGAGVLVCGCSATTGGKLLTDSGTWICRHGSVWRLSWKEAGRVVIRQRRHRGGRKAKKGSPT